MSLLDESMTRPHGSAAPDGHGPLDDAGATVLAEADGLVEVLAVADGVGRQPDLLDFLDKCGLVPGLWAEVVCQTSAGTRVEGARAHAVLPPSLAQQVLVRAIDPLID